MKTLWSQGQHSLDDAIAEFTVGDDRVIDQKIAAQDVLGSIAHVKVLEAAGILSLSDSEALRDELKRLLTQARAGQLAPSEEDEDIHSALERLLTNALGDAGRRVHTARSRNDQVATALALYMREQALAAHEEARQAVVAILEFAQTHQHHILPGTTHLQPAMPTTFGFWAAGYASLLLDDMAALELAYQASDACPLGSAAGYGVPPKHAPLNREIAAETLGFGRVLRPVTAVQGGRGKAESTLLFAMAQVSTTCARLARDVVFFVHPSMGFLKLPECFTTGSSIMPQKKNPDVFELMRGKAATIQAALHETMMLSSSVPSGYHRDFQLLKAPLMRGVEAGRSVLQMVRHVFGGLEINVERAKAACTPEIYATHRALELVTGGMPFREAYRQVASEVRSGTLPETTASRGVPELQPALLQIASRLEKAQAWHALRTIPEP